MDLSEEMLPSMTETNRDQPEYIMSTYGNEWMQLEIESRRSGVGYAFVLSTMERLYQNNQPEIGSSFFNLSQQDGEACQGISAVRCTWPNVVETEERQRQVKFIGAWLLSARQGCENPGKIKVRVAAQGLATDRRKYDDRL